MMNRLDSSLFKVIVANTPLISIDLIITDSNDRVLLGRRLNRPAQFSWFVPGGRIFKGERISDAFHRIGYEELGLNATMNDSEFIGNYEHFYNDNFSDNKFSTHYIVLGYKILLAESSVLENFPKAQHSNYRWFTIEELLNSKSVHQFTKNYFINGL